MNKHRRRYIKENGRTQLRKMTRRKSPSAPIYLTREQMNKGYRGSFNTREIGLICKVWSPIYCSWVWEASITYNGLTIKREIFEDDKLKAEEWAREKFIALRDPQFARIVHQYIMSSDYALNDIAEICGVTVGAISKWISGDTFPSVAVLVRLCVFLSGEAWESKYNTLSKMIEMERV